VRWCAHSKFLANFASCISDLHSSCVEEWSCRCLSVCDVCVLWPNNWMDQDETWHGGRRRPRTHCVTWAPSIPPLPKNGPPIFGPCLLWPNDWIYEGRPRSRRHCVIWGTSSPQKGTTPNFSPHVCCGQMAGWIKMPLGTEVGLGAGHVVLDGDPAPSRKGAHQQPTFWPTSIVFKPSPISATAEFLLQFSFLCACLA